MNTRTILAFACAGLFAAMSVSAPAQSAYLTFSSTDAFTIAPSAVSWDGALFYSSNTTDWSAFDKYGATAALDGGSGEYRLYFRGTNNTLISGGNLAYWMIDAAAPVACFGNIESLLDYTKVEAGEHPAMAANCFANLFKDCTALSSAPELAATNLVNNCYVNMFRGCTGLTNAPVLPATTLAGGCYMEMFRDCTSLAQAPELPVMTLPSSCYKGMFSNCTALATAPELPATTLGAVCYQYMFAGCTSLTNAPALQATTLVPGCYHSMFYGCTGLTRLPELPATNLASYCYAFIFADCTGITLHEDGTGQTWGIPNDAAEAMGWNTNMLAGTGGTFTNDPVIGATYYYTPPPPPAYLTFASTNAFTITPQTNSWDGTLEYSTDTTNWTLFTTAGASAVSDGSGDYKLYLRGLSNTCMTGAYNPGWTINSAGQVACSGNIETLLDYATVTNGGHPVMASYCFANLFKDCTALNSAPTLSAMTLTEGCYYYMFAGCTALTNAPALPATNLASSCYQNMFRGCISLTQAPELSVKTVYNFCYCNMFSDCKSLTNAPALLATTLAPSCYSGMFRYCAGLTNAPELPATNLAGSCYYAMFYGCTGLTQAPELPAETLSLSCYNAMFGGCTSLTNAPKLPATELDNFCCYNMFSDCTGLTQAPELLATNLAVQCYVSMFRGCTSLTNAPRLPAMMLASNCYQTMFSGCTSLTQAPDLPAVTLAENCYNAMFENCTGLTQAPELPATNLAANCYNSMFYGCTGIKLNTEGPGPEWGIPAGAAEADGWNLDMLVGTGGTFTNDPVIGVTYYFPLTAPPAPSGVSASDGTFTNKIRITWNAASLATGYAVWRHTADNSAAATEIGSAAGTSYDDVATVVKTTYYYWVKATNAAGVSGFSASDSGWRAVPKPAAPTGVAASDGAHTDKIRVTWKASAGATSYKVYRYTSNNPNAASLVGTSATTTYNDTTAKTELTYYYWVKAVNESGASGFSALDTGYLGVVGPLVAVNGMVGNNIRIPANKPITITATMMNLPAAYLGVPVDWWVAAYVHQGGLWFYFDTNFNLMPFDGNLANVRPAYQGPLYNVPPMALVENMVLPRGTYNIWFAVDYPMDGKIDLNGLMLLSAVTIVVEP